MAYFGTTEEVQYNPLNARDIERARHRRALAEWERSQTQILSPEVRQFVEQGLAPGRGNPVNIKAMTQAENAVRDANEIVANTQSFIHEPAMANLLALKRLQAGLYSEPGYGAPVPQAKPVAQDQPVSPIGISDDGSLYPTAGNYVNGNFASTLASKGIKTPTMQGVYEAQEEAYQRTPAATAARASLEAARIKARAAAEKEARDLQGKKDLASLRQGFALERIDIKNRIKSTKDALKFSQSMGDQAYKEYKQKFTPIYTYKNQAGMRYSDEELAKHLTASGIPFIVRRPGGPPEMLTGSEYVKSPGYQDELDKLQVLVPAEYRDGVNQYRKMHGANPVTEAEIIEKNVAKENFTPETAKIFQEKVLPLAKAGKPKFVELWKAFTKHHGQLITEDWSLPDPAMAQVDSMAELMITGPKRKPLPSGDRMRGMNAYDGLPPGGPSAYQSRGR